MNFIDEIICRSNDHVLGFSRMVLQFVTGKPITDLF